MKIKKIICSKGKTGFYFDDQRAIKKNAVLDGFTYKGEPVTDGFVSVRQAGESVCIQILLENGSIAYGDCAAVQYSGAGGRDPLFLAEDYIKVINDYIKPVLEGRELTSFKELAEEIDSMVNPLTNKPFHTALRYGITQALLDAVGKANGELMCEVVAREYNLKSDFKEVPIFMQSGDDRYNNVDKMIIKKADVLPHALFNNLDKTGKQGEKLVEYVAWLSKRVSELKIDENYMPVFHIDVYGTIGAAFDNDVEKIVDLLAKIEEAGKPYHVRIEGPTDVEDRTLQMESLRDIRALADKRNVNVEIVADEWCNTLEDIKYFVDNKAGHMVQIKTPDLGGINNTIEAVLYCSGKDVSAYQGGTCNETDNSAKTCVHLAMATRPVQILAKPGMGVDEGYMIVYNEMMRIVAYKEAN